MGGGGNERTNNSYTGHPAIPETISDKIYNSIVKIKTKNIFGTGFLIKIEKNNIKKFLFTCSHIVNQDLIDSNEDLEIFYGKNDEIKKIINLNKNLRFIRAFENEKDITIIEIIESDEIPDNKFLSPDLNYSAGYNNYSGEKIIVAGYPIDKVNKGRHISSGEIIEIMKDIEFKHNADTKNGSSGSPICSFDKQYVIGIHKQGDRKDKCNYGTFIGSVLDELQTNKANDTFYAQKEKKIVKEKYINIKLYIDNYLYYHKMILNSYDNQNEDNFYNELGKLKNYIAKLKNPEINPNFLDMMNIFKNIDEKYENILQISLKDKGLIKNFNKCIRYENKLLFQNLKYFIAGFIKSLDKTKYGIQNDITLYRGDKMSYNDLIKFRNNINKIIIYKGFCSASKSRGVASVYARVHENTNAYSVIVTINYKMKKNWCPYCFDVSHFSKYEEQEKVIFSVFSCFKIIKVEINENEKKAEIILNSLGRKKEIEKKIASISVENIPKVKLIEKDDVLEIEEN